MSHKRAKQLRRIGRRSDELRAAGRGPWINDQDCLKGRPMCHDCAFRRDSKEVVAYEAGVSDRGADDGPGSYSIVTRGISRMLRHGEPPQPFWCHHLTNGQDAPTDPFGYYQLEIKDGRPQGVPICAGWLAMVERHRRLMELDGEVPERENRPALEGDGAFA